MAQVGLKESFLGADGKLDWNKVNPDILRNWEEIYREGDVRKRTWDVSSDVMSTCVDASRPLSDINSVGVYHTISCIYAKPLMETWEKTKKAQAQWIANGTFPGIWCGLMHYKNAISGCPSPHTCLNITFNAKYKIYDRQCEEHVKL